MSLKKIHNRISFKELDDRVDAEYYTEEFMENERILNKIKRKTLENLVDSTKKNCIADFTSNGGFEYLSKVRFSTFGRMAFIRTQNVLASEIDLSDLLFIDADSEDKVQKSICKHGDLLVCRTGSLGAAATLPKFLEPANVNQNITRFILDRELIDADYCATFLNSRYGRLSFVRQATGVVQKWINNEKIRQVKIVALSDAAQKYIGNKVRQAERLRARSKKLEADFQNCLARDCPEIFGEIRVKSKSSRVELADLTANLNSGAYEPERLRIRRYLKKKNGKRIQDIAHLQTSVSSVYSSSDTYIGLESISSSSSIISPSTIESAQVRGSARILVGGPVISKLRPYLNKVTYISSEFDGAFGSAELVCVTPKNDVSGWFLYGVLKLDSTIRQLNPVSTGSTHPRVSREDVLELMIPWSVDHQMLGQKLEEAQKGYFLAEKLTTASKLLVEALIEGKLTEVKIKEAQEDLKRGSVNLDKEILARLTRMGIDCPHEPPLFPSLDDLYSASSNLDRAIIAKEAVIAEKVTE